MYNITNASTDAESRGDHRKNDMLAGQNRITNNNNKLHLKLLG